MVGHQLVRSSPLPLPVRYEVELPERDDLVLGRHQGHDLPGLQRQGQGDHGVGDGAGQGEQLISCASVRLGRVDEVRQALGMTAGAVDLDARTLRVDRQLTQEGRITQTKSRATRSVPLSQQSVRALMPLLVGRSVSDPIWSNSQGRPLRYQAGRRTWIGVVARAGLD